ncbi:NACHT, LRR and PYD domains-containing protein 1-like, partial [Colossoma macropomum]|uniref:NACHT, LRR and PYD domains-containing protein 1-like n=1 Tax=Colossoma macropomum TaxID=42526 RepID=UPI001863D55E
FQRKLGSLPHSQIKGTQTLRELDLSDNSLWHLGVKRLSVGLRSPDCKLERLRLADCRLVDGCADLIKALKENPSRLIELNLNNNNPRDSAVKELCDLLKKKECRLEKLELASCRILDEDCAALVEALKENPTQLKELNLNENNLRDSGVKKLCELLKKKECKLEKLQ